jgi:hypothetical protein
MSSAATVQAPSSHIPRPPRDTRVDIVRGWMQMVIFASHAAGSFIGGWLIHKAWGLSDSSEQFIFLSGLMLGSVHARRVLMQGRRAGARDMLVRAGNLYRTHLLVFALFGIMIAAACKFGLMPGELERLGWGYMMTDPWRAVLAALATLYLPEFVNILPIFAICMALLPAFAWLEDRFGDWALAVPLSLYAAVWLFGVHLPLPEGAHPLGFNPFAWQVVFMIGAWAGRRTLLRGEVLPASHWLTGGAIAVVVLGLWLRLGWYGFIPGGAPLPDIDVIWNKNDLGVLRLLHALALAWLVSRWVPRDRPWMHGVLGRWMATGGRYSLQILCLGLFLAWGVTVAFRLWPADRWWLDLVLLPLGCFILLLFARWLDRRKDTPPLAGVVTGPVAGAGRSA